MQWLVAWTAFVVVQLALPSRLATAWDTDGHQAIGMTAMSSLSGKATAQVKRLMGGRDVVDVAGWAHRVEEKHPDTAAFHQQLQDTRWACSNLQTDEENCPGNRCLVRAIQHFYTRLTGRGELFPLEYPDGLRFTDSDAVKFLVNLLGDLHQPLHVGFKFDEGGRKITLKALRAGREDLVTMYDYWDSSLVQRFIAERPATWYGGWTHAHSLGNSRLAELKREWDAEPNETKHIVFERWALNSLQKACTSIYKESKLGTPIAEGFEVSPAYDYLAMELIKTQILTAGARIGLVLNSILAERDAGKLRQGSAVDIALVQAAKASNPRKPSYLKGFAINAVIILAVGVIFVYVSRFYSSKKSAGVASRPTTKEASKRY